VTRAHPTDDAEPFQNEDQSSEPELEKAQLQEAKERSSPSGKVVYQAIIEEAREELNRPSSALFWSGIAAGLSMGFSFIAESVLRSRLPDTEWRPLVSKLGYSVGFVVVILGRQQLFTENTLTPVLPFLKHKTWSLFGNVMRLWGIVLLANLIGAVIISLVVVRTPAFSHDIRRAFVEVGHEAMRNGFGVVLLKGIFAGWLIALIVWLLPFAEAARLWVIILITWLVGAAELSHVVAGSIEVFALSWAGQKPWLTTIGSYVIPALIGNIIGGVTLVAALNHAQVKSGDGKE
jgi:formate/nitrite transporter FocA (FNT family)